MKPRIKRQWGQWLCTGQGIDRFASTPSEAYRLWWVVLAGYERFSRDTLMIRTPGWNIFTGG